MKVGILKEWEEVEINPTIRKGINDQLQHLRDLGIEIKEYSVPSAKYAFELYITLAYAEGSSNANRYDGIRFGKNSVVDNKVKVDTKLTI